MAEVITYVACSSAQVLQTPGRVIRTGRDGTIPGDFDVDVRSPRDNGPVLVGGIGVPLTMGHSGSLGITNKRQSTYSSVSRNTQKFDASVDGNLADDGDSMSIFRKLLG